MSGLDLGDLLQPFSRGSRVVKYGADFTFEGVIVATFYKRKGGWRCVVEDDRGFLAVLTDSNMRLVA